MPRYDLLIAGGTVLDPANSLEAVADVAISDGLVDRVEPEIDRSLAAEVVDAAGLWVMPGMVDGHVHVGGERATWDPALGFRMLALAGVTTGIDFGSTPETLFDGMQRLGAGINIGGLLVLRPGSTIPATTRRRPKSAPSSRTPCGGERSASKSSAATTPSRRR